MPSGHPLLNNLESIRKVCPLNSQSLPTCLAEFTKEKEMLNCFLRGILAEEALVT
jgi:hypothetical protein